MHGLRFRLTVPLAAAAIVVGGSVAFGALSDNFTNPAAPVPGNGQPIDLAMTGAKTGKFPGPVTTAGHEQAIEVLGLDFGRTSSIRFTGLGSGRAACQGVNFRKTTDQSTPLLFASEATNEPITSATFDELGPSLGDAPTTRLSVKLTNSIITSVHHVDASTTGAYEDVTLSPQKVTLTFPSGGAPSGGGGGSTTATYTCR